MNDEFEVARDAPVWFTAASQPTENG